MEKKKMMLLLFLSFVALAKSEMAMPSTEKFYEDLLDEYDFSGSGFSTDDEGGDEGELYSGSGDLSEQDQGWNVHTPHKGEKMVTNPTMVLPTTTQNTVKLLVGESAEDYPEESGSAGETGTETPSDPWIQRGLAPEGSSPYDVSAHKIPRRKPPGPHGSSGRHHRRRRSGPPLRRLPHPLPGVPHAEEGGRQLLGGRTATLQDQPGVPKGPQR
ncbi:uncharacterized protein LOC133344193 [Lethenteron reissneri]|uniref:uncharacterized protein LOC133344193 n=1 Tax=Lethenteron reissneri TaxID=7753 RepID=UPI002AB61090|nr:uncharacterized protein LOC133344193 [Lethenteron reissneri]